MEVRQLESEKMPVGIMVINVGTTATSFYWRKANQKISHTPATAEEHYALL